MTNHPAAIFLIVPMILCLFSAPVHAAGEIGVRLGAGQIDNQKESYIADRYRGMLDVYFDWQLLHSEPLVLSLLLETELSAWEFDVDELEHINTIRGSMFFGEVTPTIGLGVGADPRLELLVGGGLTAAVEKTRSEVETLESEPVEADVTDFQFGVHVRPSVRVLAGPVTATAMVRYRVLSGERETDYDETPVPLGDQDIDFEKQYLTIRGTVNVDLGSVKPLIGVQFENDVLKYEWESEWRDWPDDWEAMVLVGLTIPIE